MDYVNNEGIVGDGSAGGDVMTEMNFLDGQNIYIRPYGKDNLGLYRQRCCSCGGKRIGKKIGLKRLFPMTKPFSYIQIVDEANKEIGILKDTSSVDYKSQMYISEYLDEFYFIPKIQEIHDIQEEYRISRWDVTTDKGRCAFEVLSRTTDIHVLEEGKVIVRDADNNRYEIPDYRKLPRRSRRLLENEI